MLALTSAGKSFTQPEAKVQNTPLQLGDIGDAGIIGDNLLCKHQL